MNQTDDDQLAIQLYLLHRVNDSYIAVMKQIFAAGVAGAEVLAVCKQVDETLQLAVNERDPVKVEKLSLFVLNKTEEIGLLALSQSGFANASKLLNSVQAKLTNTDNNEC